MPSPVDLPMAKKVRTGRAPTISSATFQIPPEIILALDSREEGNLST
jgi:hypothetical protein